MQAPAVAREIAVAADNAVARNDDGDGIGRAGTRDGANLARLELEVIFAELARRLEFAESTAPLERLRSSFVGGIKHMPISYKMNRAAD